MILRSSPGRSGKLNRFNTGCYKVAFLTSAAAVDGLSRLASVADVDGSSSDRLSGHAVNWDEAADIVLSVDILESRGGIFAQ